MLVMSGLCIEAWAGTPAGKASVSGAETEQDAAPDDAGKVRFAYDADFEMKFDNREFDHSHILPSMTIFGARLTPAIGMTYRQKNGARHRLMAGLDIMKDFGRSPVQASGGSADGDAAGEGVFEHTAVQPQCDPADSAAGVPPGTGHRKGNGSRLGDAQRRLHVLPDQLGQFVHGHAPFASPSYKRTPARRAPAGVNQGN